MIKKLIISLALFSLSSLVHSQQIFYAGIGGSEHAIKIDTNLSGNLNAISGFPPTGLFTATNHSFDHTQYHFAPELQLGYLQNFNTGPWQWGVKLFYEYLNASHTQSTTLEYTSSMNVIDEITGSLKTGIRQDIAALLLIGWHYSCGLVYVGIGPSLFNITNHLLNVSDTNSGLYIGTVNTFHHGSAWLWGGVLQLGTHFYLNPSWFIDLNFSYAMSQRYRYNNQSTFSPANGGLNGGEVYFNNDNRVSTSFLSISLNKIFND